MQRFAAFAPDDFTVEVHLRKIKRRLTSRQVNKLTTIFFANIDAMPAAVFRIAIFGRHLMDVAQRLVELRWETYEHMAKQDPREFQPVA